MQTTWRHALITDQRILQSDWSRLINVSRNLGLDGKGCQQPPTNTGLRFIISLVTISSGLILSRGTNDWRNLQSN